MFENSSIAQTQRNVGAAMDTGEYNRIIDPPERGNPLDEYTDWTAVAEWFAAAVKAETEGKKMNEIFTKMARPFPKEAYKDVTLGRTFTTIDAYHIIERLTEVFGLCGTGWGVHVREWHVDGTNLAADGVLWYLQADVRNEVEATGDAMVIKGNVAEARKKARTNLISKAASYLGCGLSVYQGRGIDDPYLDRAHAAAEKAPPQKPLADVRISGAWVERLTTLAHEKGLRPEALSEQICVEFGLNDLAELTQAQARKLAGWITGGGKKEV